MQNYRYRSTGSSRGCVRQQKEEKECVSMPVAMAYVPWTRWENIYEIEKGFCRGTIFQDLDKPFLGIGGCQNVR